MGDIGSRGNPAAGVWGMAASGHGTRRVARTKPFQEISAASSGVAGVAKDFGLEYPDLITLLLWYSGTLERIFPLVRPYFSHDESQRHMVAETSAFITWGLRHPEQVRWIPKRPIDDGAFSVRMTFVFWTPVLGLSMLKPITWLRRLLGR